ncbi:MFS transporter [Sulfobacillus harzensis]|uniref:MFS transporter n=1 Tax=Sulfobacillus harzensis TaxID=2729629 RepID=A0A7Y0Q468_9FIRM|nr:MFS transporter [Sulfobacillus harzensis]NMP24110.1 MFS transporter [Sulfobacillus harzensis]
MKPTNVRWGVITLLFFATSINYLDRTNLSVALPVMAKDFHWTPILMGSISAAFGITYGLAQIPIGPLIDKIGTRLTYVWSMIIWSLASMATAIGNSFGSIYIFRLILGVGEAPAFPAATKTAADWIPRPQRGVATGFFTAGVNMGSAIALPLVAWLVTVYGWHASFIVTGLLGFLWLIVWLVFYRNRPENRRMNDAERELIETGVDDVKEEQDRVPWTRLFSYKSTWGLMLGYFCQVYIMYVFITWLPSYLVDSRHMTLLHTGIYGTLPFIFGTISAFLGGWLSDLWVRKTANGRKWAMSLGLVVGLAVIPAAFVTSTGLALFFITVAEFGVMFSNGAAWATSSEIAPRGQKASVAGMQNFGGNVGAFLAPLVTGILVQATHSFVAALVLSGVLAFIGAVLYFVMLPQSRTQELVTQRLHTAS